MLKVSLRWGKKSPQNVSTAAPYKIGPALTFTFVSNFIFEMFKYLLDSDVKSSLGKIWCETYLEKFCTCYVYLPVNRAVHQRK